MYFMFNKNWYSLYREDTDAVSRTGCHVQCGGPNSPALAARASFCWMWYSWNRMEILWVIFRYFCRHDSEQVDWQQWGSVNDTNQHFLTAWWRLHDTVYLIRFHVSAGEVFDAVHEAVLRHLVVRSQELLELQREQRNVHDRWTWTNQKHQMSVRGTQMEHQREHRAASNYRPREDWGQWRPPCRFPNLIVSRPTNRDVILSVVSCCVAGVE